jgi:hypothetical protein
MTSIAFVLSRRWRLVAFALLGAGAVGCMPDASIGDEDSSAGGGDSGTYALALPVHPWPVLLLVDTSDSMWYRREIVVRNLERLALFDAALPRGAKMELRRIDAPTALPTLCDLPRSFGDVHAMMDDVAALSEYSIYDRVDSDAFSNGSRSMPTWYLADYLARNAFSGAPGSMVVWTIQDGPDVSSLFRDVDPLQAAMEVERLWAERGGAGIQWNVVAEAEQTGTGISAPGCYADATNLATLADASDGRFVHFCTDRTWAEAIVDSAWEHYLQPVSTLLPPNLDASGWRLIAERQDGVQEGCQVAELPVERTVPRCLPFEREGDRVVFRAADILDVVSLAVEFGQEG